MTSPNVVRVYVRDGDLRLLEIISKKLGWSQSETMVTAFREYAKSLSVVSQEVHS